MKLLKTLTRVLLVAIVGTLLLVGILISFSKEAWFATYGTFYGGVMGPVATTFGFYFIYSAYLNQKAEADFALLNKLYSDLLEDIASIHFRDKKKGVMPFLFRKDDVYQGIDALFNFNMNDANNSVLNHLNLIIRSFIYLTDRVEKSAYKDEDTKIILLNKVHLLYYAKIIWPVFQGVYRYKDEIFVRGWGNPKELFLEFEKFTKITVLYLVSQDIIENPRTSKYPEKLVLNILNTDYDLPNVWAHLTYTNAHNNFAFPVPLRTKIGKKLSLFLPPAVVDFIKVHTRYRIFLVA